MKSWIVAWSIVSLAGSPHAQNLLNNCGFETGTTQPDGWRLAAGNGQRVSPAYQGEHGVQVTGSGEDSSYWRAESVKLSPVSLYRLRFYGKTVPGSSGGTAISGVNDVNRDFVLTDAWQQYEYVLSTPEKIERAYYQLGQWHLRGSAVFDDAGLWPVLVTHRWGPSELELGEGESVVGRTYRFNPNFGWVGANYHRPLQVNRAAFNSDRWVFGPGAEVVYRLKIAGCAQTAARLRVAINYYDGGELTIEAGKAMGEWRPVAVYDGTTRGGMADLPPIFPAAEVFVRLRHSGKTGALQVNTFDYRSDLDRDMPEFHGETRFMDQLETAPDLDVQLEKAELSPDRKTWRMQFALRTTNAGIQNVRGNVSEDIEMSSEKSVNTVSLSPAKGASDNRATTAQVRSFEPALLTCPAGAPGTHALMARFEDNNGRTLFVGRLSVQTGFLDDLRPGYWLSENEDIGFWWCESGWKIGRERGLPEKPANGRAKPIQVSLARGEFEPVQVVLRPLKEGQLLSARLHFVSIADQQSPELVARIDEVAYVRVVQPTDRTCLPGWYPDPLPPLLLPIKLRASENQPLWITIQAPLNTRPGKYGGEIEIETTFGPTRFPLAIQVYDFELPRETHLQSALGLNSSTISRYHGLGRREDQEAVYEKYLRNFAGHRISPYSFYDYAPFNVRFEGTGTDKQARVDFTRFDRVAARWLDEYRFSTFQLRLLGMGGGTFQSRSLGRLEGFEEGTPEHARLFQDYLSQVERHLRERGWLDKAFTYWFDEPDPKDYEFVVAGMKRLKAAAPGIKRMLTEQPEPALKGHVDIWCGLTPEWTRERVEACRAAGERVWWYICCGPTAPYVTEFIDHPGTELRLWPWQSWQYGVTGILIWETTYWNSPLVFPNPKRQDPWSDPMSYVSGYDYPVGHVGYWGNGDGRFLYPPRAALQTTNAPCLDEPVSSLRWENLRDGMEDYEYLWLLEQEINRLAKTDKVSELVREARSLLNVPDEVSKDTTHFTTDPRPILRHRERVARMIVRLKSQP